MPLERPHHHAFKRVERDDEFRARLVRTGLGNWEVSGLKDKDLDEFAWARKQMQRRIVDDVA